MVGLADRVDFVQGDATRMPFPDASFDRVFGQEAWVHIADKAALVGEIRRVLVPGGVLAFTDIVSIAPLTDEENAKLAAEMQFPPIVTAAALSRRAVSRRIHDRSSRRSVRGMEGDSPRAAGDVSIAARHHDCEVWRSALREVGSEVRRLRRPLRGGQAGRRSIRRDEGSLARVGLAGASRAPSEQGSSEQGSFGAGLLRSRAPHGAGLLTEQGSFGAGLLRSRAPRSRAPSEQGSFGAGLLRSRAPSEQGSSAEQGSSRSRAPHGAGLLRSRAPSEQGSRAGRLRFARRRWVPPCSSQEAPRCPLSTKPWWSGSGRTICSSISDRLTYQQFPRDEQFELGRQIRRAAYSVPRKHRGRICETTRARQDQLLQHRVGIPQRVDLRSPCSAPPGISGRRILPGTRRSDAHGRRPAERPDPIHARENGRRRCDQTDCFRACGGAAVQLALNRAAESPPLLGAKAPSPARERSDASPAPKEPCSEGALLRRSPAPKEPCSEGALLRRSPAPKEPCSEGALLRRSPALEEPCSVRSPARVASPGLRYTSHSDQGPDLRMYERRRRSLRLPRCVFPDRLVLIRFDR